MSSSVKERVLEFIKFKKISMKTFELQCDLSTGYVTSMRKSFGDKKLNNVLTAFPELNRDWLLYGEGEMLKHQDSPILDVNSQTQNSPRLIPFYDVETTGGYNGRISSSSDEGNLIGYIQPGGWFDGRETAAIRHVGDSMVEYPDGCILAVKEVKERHLLVPGRNYVIETTEYRITKRVQRGSSRDTLMLYSSNTERYEDGRLIHEPFEIHLEDVRRIFSILGYIVNQSGEMRLIKG